MRQGQTLAVLDTPELDQQVQATSASVAQANANLHLAHTTAGRYEDLEGSEAVSQQEVDQSRQALQAQQAVAQIATAEWNRVKQLQGFERVTAPFSGVITSRRVDIGDLINAGGGPSGSEMFRLARIDVVRIFVNVPEIDSVYIKPGMEAIIEPLTLQGEHLSGRVVRSSDAIDPTSHTMRVEIDIQNRDGRLVPGTFANITLRFGKGTTALVVPSEAVLYQAAGPQVAVVTRGRIALRKVVLGTDFGETIEVRSGISAADAIVIAPPDFVLDGTPVQVVGKAQ